MRVRKDRLKLSKKYRRERLRDRTYYERWFEDFLTGYRYIPEKVIFVNDYRFYIVDFYLPKHRVVIEIDGVQHENNKKYDRKRTKELKNRGIRKVIRFKNTDLKEMSAERIEQILKINLVA